MRESRVAKGGQPFAWGFGAAPPIIPPSPLPPQAAKTTLQQPWVLPQVLIPQRGTYML
jgi:hypothetical protein